MKIIKNNLKEQALELREIKNSIRNGMNFDKKNVWRYQIDLFEKKKQYRYNHIAYCMIRGKEYHQIERNTSPDNKIDMSEVEKIIKFFSNNISKRHTVQEKYDV